MITDFWRGIIIGVVFSVIIFGFVGVLFYRTRKEKEVIKYVEIQAIHEALREDYVSRDPYDFIDTVPGVRGAADGAFTDFERRRDEALQRFRAGLAD